MTSGILGFVLRVGVFLVAGPIIGGIVFVFIAALVGSEDIAGGIAGGFVMIVLALPLFLIGCYVMGWKAALIAGLVLALAGPQINSRSLLFAVAAIVGAVAAAGLAYEGKNPSDMLITVVGAISALACTWFLDRINLMRAAGSRFA